jgi:O-antigen ligase
MTALAITGPATRARLERFADGVAAAAAVSLPWSTSLTSILIGMWLLCLLPTFGFSSSRRTMRLPAAYLPAALFALAMIGMLWADVPMRERLGGLGPYVKLLVIPLLLWQFSRRDSGERLLWAFLGSATLLLTLSWLFAVFPALSWRDPGWQYGIPVKDYISQSGIFTLCFFALIERALAAWPRAKARVLGLLALASAFLANIVFIASSRTSLVVICVLFVFLGFMRLGRRGIFVLFALMVMLVAVSWAASPYLRWRVGSVVTELQTFSPTNDTSSGARLSFWKNSLSIIRDAPVVGHGTGSIRAMFAQATGVDAASAGVASNPHNQILAVAIPLGGAGALLLVAMWASHVRLFWARDFAAWIGLIVVVQNIVSSMFNSHLLDFTQGWLYVWGVGVAGGMVLRQRAPPPPSAALTS